MEDAVGEVEIVNYNAENLKLDENDKLENKIFRKSNRIDNDQHHQIEFAMIGRNDAKLDKATAIRLQELNKTVENEIFG